MTDNISMESAVTSPNQDSATVNVEHDIAELVDGSVFTHLQKLVADPKALKQKAILNDARDMAYYRSISHQLNHFLGGCISILYRKVISHDIASKVADLVANEVNVRFGGSPVALTDEELKRLEVAFMATEYVGDASDNFEKYLWSCWYEYNPRGLYDRHERQYIRSGGRYKSPCVAVVQSSGLGKSRMLFELARRAEQGDSRMKVLYICARSRESTGVPKATPKLRDWLFVKNDYRGTKICARLMACPPAAGRSRVDVNLPVSTKLGLEPPNPFQDPGLASFPPFVLSRTVDVHWKKHCTGVYQQSGGKEGVGDEDDGIGVGDTIDGDKVETQVVAYKTAVTGSESAAWEALARMGRPLWSSVLNSPMEENGVERPTTRGDVINLAAQKLLLGCTVVRGSYNELTLSGVASLLCRLGLRPHCSLALASRSVVDLMAVLAYVNFEKDGCLSTYASDPIANAGRHESVIGDKGQVVARLLLLLAMDKCVVGDTKPSECEFVGQFIPVQTFMDVLGVADLPIKCKGMTAASEATKTAFNEWRSQWEGWHMGFTHFVQLEGEPNEETLWVLLGRRAAGVLPRSQKGANLLIPTFKKKDSTAEAKVNSPIDSEAKVGVILIQLTSRSPRDCESATEKLSVVRSDGRPEIIRMYMNVREEARTHFRFVYCESSDAVASNEPGVSGSKADTKTTATSEDAFALCFHSVSCATYPFLEEGVATQLAGLLTSRWDPMASVDGGLEHRNEAELAWGEEENEAALSVVMPDEEFR
ncbi:hypothetical protein PRIC2_013948 [Phytophthora ramorum]